MTTRYRAVAALLTEEWNEGSISTDVYDYWMHRLEQANTAAEIDAVEAEYYGKPRRRNGTVPVGASVTEGKRQGVVVAHRPQGMVDVRFKGGLGIERRKASNLRVVRSNPAPKSKAESYDPAKEQYYAVVQGVYESLVTDFLGVRNFRWRGERADERGLADGRLTRDDIDAMVSRAFAIATAQEQRSRRLKKGTNVPTTRGVQAAAGRRRDKAHTAANAADFERTLELRRKTRKNGALSAVTRLAKTAKSVATGPTARKAWTSVKKTASSVAKSPEVRQFFRDATHAARTQLAETVGSHTADKTAELARMPKRKNGAGTKIAAKAGGKAIPFIGQAMMVIDAAPAIWDEGKHRLTREYRVAKETVGMARRGKVRDAVRHAGREAWADVKDIPRMVSRIAVTGIAGKDAYELIKKRGKKK
jgi:hypothetical protein